MSKCPTSESGTRRMSYLTLDNAGSVLVLNNILGGPGPISGPDLTISEGLTPLQFMKIFK
jgi:hypothetical protein